MSGSDIYIHYDDDRKCFYSPLRGNIALQRLWLKRDDLTLLHVQGVTSSRDWQYKPGSGATGFKAPDAACLNWSWLSNAVFGFKTVANSEDHGDFEASFSGLYSSASWDALNKARFTMAIVLPSTVTDDSQYYGEFELLDTSVNRVTLGGLNVRLPLQIVTGDESNTPTTFNPAYGTATITAGNDSVPVTDTDMTTDGFIIPFFLSAAVSTISATAGTGTFTIQLGGPVVANTTVGYYIIRRTA